MWKYEELMSQGRKVREEETNCRKVRGGSKSEAQESKNSDAMQ